MKLKKYISILAIFTISLSMVGCLKKSNIQSSVTTSSVEENLKQVQNSTNTLATDCDYVVYDAKSSDQYNNYSPLNVLDDDSNSSWVLNDKYGKGIGEWIQINFDKEVQLDKFYIVNGLGWNGDNNESYLKNNRVKTLEVEFSNGEKQEINLEDNKVEEQEIALNKSIKTDYVKFTIKDTNEIQKVNMIDKIVEISKTDITNGNELEGAELEVIDEDGNTIDKWTSTKEPHQVKGLEEGKTYILKEKTAPYGYEITEEIEFVVTTEKDTQKIEMKDMPILKNVKVIKVDSETKETIKDKFIFGIYEDPECTKLIKEVKSNKEDGTALFEELRYGTYYIKEIKAPKDYELSSRVAKVEINDKGIFVDDEQVEETDSTIEFTFENKKIEVPKTGDESRIKLFAGAMIVSLFGIGYIVIHNHNKNTKK